MTNGVLISKKEEKKQFRFNNQRRAINPVSDFNLVHISLLDKNKSPHWVFIYDLAPLWRLYATLQIYDQWWLFFPNYQLTTLCISFSRRAPVSVIYLFKPKICQLFIRWVFFLFTGTNHHSMYFHQPERHRGACMPLHTKNVHHRLPAGEKRQASHHELSQLQKACHQYLLCVGSQQSW